MEKEENSFRNKIIYCPRLFNGPIDLNYLIGANHIDDIMKELIIYLKKNDIYFKWEKNNNCKFYCTKNENNFKIEIFSICNKDIGNIKLYYFTCISSSSHRLILKAYFEAIYRFIEKYRIKNLNF